MDTLTRNYRSQTLKLRAATLRDLQLLWPTLNLDHLDESFPRWAALATALIQRDRRRVAALTGSYLRAERLAQGVSGEAAVVLAGAAPAAQVATSLEVTAKAGYRTALRYYPPEKAAEVAFVRSSGAATRLVLNAGRETTGASLQADSKGKGWRRATSPGACKLCTELAGRGFVYSKTTVDFSAHDWCVCTAIPVYGNEFREVREYTPSTRFSTQEARDAHNARTREWLNNL